MQQPIRSLILVVCLLCTAGIQLAYAQPAPTPTPQITATASASPVSNLVGRATATSTLQVTGAPFIVKTATEMLFPAVALVQVEINVPLERVVSAQVHIFQPETGLDFTTDIDLSSEDNARESVSGALLYYGWRFDPLTAPPLFSYVEFDWTIRLVENVTARAFGGFTFADTRLFSAQKIESWRTVGSSGSDIQLTGHAPNLALDIIQTRSQRVYDKVKRTLIPLPPFHFIIYDPGIVFCGDAFDDDGNIYIQSITTSIYYLCSPQDALELYHHQGYQFIERANVGLEQLIEQVNDAILRESFARAWRVSQPPAWFREGLYQLYRPVTDTRALQIVRNTERTTGLIPLELLRTEPEDLALTELWRAHSYLMVLFLADRYGADAPFQVATAIRDIYTFESALQTLLGIDSAALYGQWRRWLLTEDADRAVRWTPYLTTTSTPTEAPRPFPTRAATSAQPTNTLTPRPTLTAPPFATFTPVPPSPTNTPRPAGSLRSPTPVPTIVPEGTLSTIARSPIAVLGVVGIIVTVLFVILSLGMRARQR